MNYIVVYLIDGDVIMFVNLFHRTQEYDSERYWKDLGERTVTSAFQAMSIKTP